MCVCVHACVQCVCVRVYICVYVCAYVRMCVCVKVHGVQFMYSKCVCAHEGVRHLEAFIHVL